MTRLRVAVIAPEDAAARQDAGAVLTALAGDSRLELAALIEAFPTDRPGLAFILATGWEKPLARRASRAAPDFSTLRRMKLAEIGEAAPFAVDVVVDLVGVSAPPALFAASRLGVWSLTAFEPYRGFWDSYRREAASRAAIVARSTPDDPGATIASGAYNTKFLASRNSGFLREKSAQLLLRELARVQRGEGPAASPAPSRRGAPGFADALGYAFGAAGALADRAADLTRERLGARPGMWALMLGDGDAFSFDPARALRIAAPDDAYWADPFLFKHRGETYVFFEDYPYRTKTARIAVARIVSRRFEFLGPALETGYHLSFPFVFSHAGEIYMLPETHQSGRLEIWRCTDFPFRWSLHATALDGAAPADSVLFEHRGEWRLFTSFADAAYGDNSSELYLFRVDGPSLDRLEPHPLNPVVIDSRTARPAGRVFARGEALYRLSQDNAYGLYGYGLNLMEITRLDEEGYAERLVRRIEPTFSRGLIGCHHFDSLDGICIFDARWKIGGRAKKRLAIARRVAE